MKKQNLKVLYLLVSLILFLQANYFSLFSQTQQESLYTRLGGVYNIAAVVDNFVDRLLDDPLIIANKNVVTAIGKITKPGLKYELTEWFCQAVGGPQKYNGRSMKESHQGLNITESEWQSMMKDFLATLAKFNIKGVEQNELLVIVGNTKNDIVIPAPQVLQLQIPALPSTLPSNVIPKSLVLPSLPSPANVLQAMPTTPQLPTLMNAPSIPAPVVPVLPNPLNKPSEIPSLPGSTNTPPPEAPEIRIVPSPANKPSPEVLFHIVQPKLEISPGNHIEVQSEQPGAEPEGAGDSSINTNTDEEAPSDTSEAVLEPAE